MIDKVRGGKRIVLGIQFLFVAFGATVLVPLLTGIDPAVALFTAGIGTLVFHLITKGKVPIYLGSSFAFVAPIIKATELYGMPGAMCGIIAVGLVYATFSMIIKFFGLGIIHRLFPKIVVGPVIIIIGLSLSSTGVKMASSNWTVALASLITAVVVSIYVKGFFKLIPIFCGVIVGYLTSMLLGIIDYSAISQASWIAFPHFVFPKWSFGAITYMIPVAIAPMIEHIGDMYAISNVAHKDFIKDPGLHRTLLGDGIASTIAACFGGPPNTTYSEVTGAVALTKVVDPSIMRVSAIAALIFSLVGKISAFLTTIPESVLGGIMLMLFGLIASVGIKNLVDEKEKLEENRNQIIVAIILTVGIGGAVVKFGSFSMAGIGLASIVGVLLNLILPERKDSIDIKVKSKVSKGN